MHFKKSSGVDISPFYCPLNCGCILKTGQTKLRMDFMWNVMKIGKTEKFFCSVNDFLFYIFC